MTTYVVQRMPHKRCCRISIVLAFSFGRAKTIGVRSVFKKIGVHVDRASVVFN